MKMMYQSYLFADMVNEMPFHPKAVNVASVPHHSPFRYPGGKTWFVPTLRQWLASRSARPALLVEPFVGGGIISLTSLFENLVDRALMIELDEQIAAVWQAITDGDAQWLARRIMTFELTTETVKNELAKKYDENKQIAFQTILKNRTLHGGILAPGSGFLKNGENGKGILSRWYPKTLAQRFQKLDLIRSRMTFQCTDGLEVMAAHALQQDAVFFIDPPYTAGGKKAGHRLYKYNDIDHERLFHLCHNLVGDFILTYDCAEEVKNLARKHGFQMKLIAMRNTHNNKMTELVIGKDLTWMDSAPQIHEISSIYEI